MKLKILRVLEDYEDKSFVYSVLLNKAQSHYGRLKTLFKIPIIITSSLMSILNSNFTTDDNALRIVNITFNLLTALILSLGTTLKLEEKQANFLIAEKKFMKLTSVIEQKVISEEEISIDFINNVMNQYDSIVDGIDYDIPSYIAKAVRKEYATKKTLPLVINGIKKKVDDEGFNNSLKKISIDQLDDKISSNMIFKPLVKSPRVIETKPFSFDIPLEKIEGLQL